MTSSIHLFEFRGHYDDVISSLRVKWDIKSYLKFILYQNMKIKLGVNGHLKELQWILYRHVFAHICYVLQEFTRKYMYLKRTLIPLLMFTNRWTRYQNAWKNVPNMMNEKIWRFYVAKCHDVRKRARMRVCAFFCEMFNMTLFVLSFNSWAFLNFNARIRACHDLYLTFGVMTCCPLTWSICDMNMIDLWWRVMKIWWIMWFHKMAPGWRHEDLMTLKVLLSRLMTMTYDCAKIERKWLNWSWVILGRKKWGEINQKK